MAPANNDTENSSRVVLGFIVIFAAIALGVFVHAFLQPDLYPGKDSYLVIGTTTATLSTLLIMALFLRTQQLETKLKSKELLQAKEDWEKTFNTMTDFVSVHDKDFIITKVNHALCEFLGKKPEELIGSLCYKLFHNLNAPYDNCPHLKAAELEHPLTEIVSDPYLGVPLQITCAPFFDENGEFQGSVHMARVLPAVETTSNKIEELIPICASCKNIREDDHNWIIPEEFFLKNYDAQFTHTLCKGCQKKLYPELM